MFERKLLIALFAFFSLISISSENLQNSKNSNVQNEKIQKLIGNEQFDPIKIILNPFKKFFEQYLGENLNFDIGHLPLQSIEEQLTKNPIDLGDVYGKSIKVVNDYSDKNNVGCQCNENGCACCNSTSILRGKLCTEILFLKSQLGFTFTIIYRDHILINQTIGASTLPDVCFSVSYAIQLATVCIKVTHLHYESPNLNLCLEVIIHAPPIFENIPMTIGCSKVSLHGINLYANAAATEIFLDLLRKDDESLEYYDKGHIAVKIN